MRKLLVIFLSVAFILGLGAFYLYNSLFVKQSMSIDLPVTIRIPTNATLDDALDTLKVNGLANPGLFGGLAGQMNYNDRTLKSGKFLIEPQTSLVDLIRQLRSGKQAPVDLIINNVRTKEELAGKISANIELDSIDFLQCLDSIDISEDTFLTHFIPNTYSVYWDIECAALISRMKLESRNFWHEADRLKKAKALGLTATQVYSLASIVEKESTLDSEKPLIASVYLNRIERGMKLQADPTVVFANGDFTIRRVLNKHLEKDSPYNTYLYPGIPPGPICMPSITSIDAVLNAPKTDYIFFCAKPGYQNGHAFAASLRGHNNNAIRYREWLKSEGIR